MSGYGQAALALVGIALTAYVLFGGADFGAGLWHLITRSRRERALIEHAMGPIWEANHVWLIFAMVLTWTAFPPVFATVMSQYWVPMSLAALGIVARGAGFAFRKTLPDHYGYGLLFGASSLLTPFCLGAIAGSVTGDAQGWLAPRGIYSGVLAVGVCAYLAAVYLTWDARRHDGPVAAEAFRRRALITGAGVGATALPAAFALGVDQPLVAASAVAGMASIVLLAVRAYVPVRITAALAVAAVVWGGLLLAVPVLDVADVVATDAALIPLLVAVGIAAAVVTPSLIWLYLLFQRTDDEQAPQSAPMARCAAGHDEIEE